MPRSAHVMIASGFQQGHHAAMVPISQHRRSSRQKKRALPALCLGGLATLAACAGPARQPSAPPGAAVNQWSPYIQEASTRFAIPQAWIRAVMQQESGGHQYMHGRLTRSIHGAVGLMQIKPDTYRELARRYHLGSNPYNPHDNIMAGSAYIRELYERFGSPNFLVAYSCGPQCAENHRRGKASLPSYARTYLASVRPHLNDPVPATLRTTEMAYSPAPALPAAPQVPENVSGSAPDSPALPAPSGVDEEGIAVSSAAGTDPDLTAPAVATAAEQTPYQAPAAATLWQQDTGGNAMIQIGAFSTQERAMQAAALARQSSDSLASAVNRIELISAADGRQVWRTRLAGLSVTQTGPICSQLRQQGLACILVVDQ